jgi:hypothetical protein
LKRESGDLPEVGRVSLLGEGDLDNFRILFSFDVFS